jgi:uncharacterized protein YuzE
MVAVNFEDYLKFLPIIDQTPQKNVWLNYDEEADVLYVNIKRPSVATDSELTDDDVIIRYEENEMVGMTILHARHRS